MPNKRKTPNRKLLAQITSLKVIVESQDPVTGKKTKHKILNWSKKDGTIYYQASVDVQLEPLYSMDSQSPVDYEDCGQNFSLKASLRHPPILK